MKKAFLVLGPEGSGTKLITRMMIDAGCYGDATHRQRIDRDGPTGDLVVLRRSYPYADEWPDMVEILRILKGYDVAAIVAIRSFQFTVKSRARRTKKKKRSRRRALEALPRILADVSDHKIPYIWVNYESLVQRPAVEANYIFDWAGLRAVRKIDYIRDGNDRYVR